MKIFVKEMIKSLYSLIDHEKTTIDQIEEIDHLKELVYQCFKSLSYYIGNNDFFSIFAESKKFL